jgi:hypothetical protein
MPTMRVAPFFDPFEHCHLRILRRPQKQGRSKSGFKSSVCWCTIFFQFGTNKEFKKKEFVKPIKSIHGMALRQAGKACSASVAKFARPSLKGW